MVLENKIELPDSKVIEELNKLGLKKKSTKWKVERIIDSLNTSLKNHKDFENEKQKQ